MPVNRRTFLSLSTAAVAAFALDPDLLLWRPGAKTIFIPPPSRVRYYSSVPGKFGRIARGPRLTGREYNQIVGIQTVWLDDTETGITTVTFPVVELRDDIAPKRRSTAMRITVPVSQARVTSIGGL